MAVGQEATLLDSRETSIATAQAVKQVGAELPYCDRSSEAVREWVAKSVGPEKLQNCGLNPDLYIPRVELGNQNIAREGAAPAQSSRQSEDTTISQTDFRQRYEKEIARRTTSPVSTVPSTTAIAVSFSDQLAESYRGIAEECLKNGNLDAFNKLTEITDRDLPQAQAQAIRAMAAQTKVA